MSYLQIFKRIIPFFLTFAAGLLIASIFVPITTPSFRNADRGGKWRHHRECKREKESLRRENDRMRQELDEIKRELASAHPYQQWLAENLVSPTQSGWGEAFSKLDMVLHG